MEFAQAVFFSLPFILAGLVHIVVIRYRLLGRLARMPLDFGLKLRGRRLFGDNKTLRGALLMTVAVTGWFMLQSAILRRYPSARVLTPFDYQSISPLVWGPLLGLGCVLGELPNSFAKRQLDIAPGKQAKGLFAPMFWLLDQIDSLLGVLLVASLFWELTWLVILYLLIIALIIHPAGALIMVIVGVKSRLG